MRAHKNYDYWGVMLLGVWWCSSMSSAVQWHEICSAYEKGAYATASQLLREYQPKDAYAWALLADSASEEGAHADALLAARRAQRYGLWQLFMPLQEIIKKSKVAVGQPFLVWREYGSAVSLLIPPVVLALLFVVNYWLVLAMICYYRNRHASTRSAVFIGISVLSTALSGLLWYYGTQDIRRISGVMKEQKTALSVLPIEGAPQRDIVPFGHEVSVLQAQDGWYKIAHDTTIGWVPAATLELIEKGSLLNSMVL